MLLEKSENLLKLSVKQLVIQSRLASSIYLMCEKPDVNAVCRKVRYFRIQQELSKSKFSLIPFK